MEKTLIQQVQDATNDALALRAKLAKLTVLARQQEDLDGSAERHLDDAWGNIDNAIIYLTIARDNLNGSKRTIEL
ncbi:MAG TPA: hypothetical protein VH593_10190 [Ktedonobacteraceae bacterium]